MRRKITEKLLEWKRSGAEKKCLVVRGARQTGKTYSIDRFAKENYSRYYRLDLHEDVDARTISSSSSISTCSSPERVPS